MSARSLFFIGTLGVFSLLLFAQSSLGAQTTGMSPKCMSAATRYSACLDTKYGACKGKTGSALLTCMQTALKTGTPCNPQQFTVCLSSSCQAAVTALDQCAKALKTACTGKKGTELSSCIKAQKVSTPSCDPKNASACVAEVKVKASSSASSFSSTSRSSSSAFSSSARTRTRGW